MPWTTAEDVKAALEQVGMVDFLRDNTIPETLDATLGDGNWEVIFHQFAVSEYSTENLDFLRAVATFENSGDLGQAAEIYKQYVSTIAPTQVNLPGGVRTDLDAIFGEGGTEVGPPSLFDSAKNEILKMMKGDTFPRFKTQAKMAQDGWAKEIDWESVEGRERS